MSARPKPRIQFDEIVAGLVLEPNGGHKLEIAVPSQVIAVRFTYEQVGQLERAIALFRERALFEDARAEIYNRRFIPLLVR